MMKQVIKQEKRVEYTFKTNEGTDEPVYNCCMLGVHIRKMAGEKKKQRR